MDDDDMWWWQQDLEMREMLECEHGVHRDSGHWCAECVVNERSEDEQ